MATTFGSRDYGRFDQLAEEFAARYRRGERPSLQEYIDRLPEMADEIRQMFPALVEVERAEAELRREPPVPPAAPPHRLSEIGDYRIVREAGRGGMGVVYEAEQVSLGRRVALKVLPGHVAGDRMALERFRREAKAAARLHHTNIVPVFEVGRDGGVAYYAMQFIQGQGLDQVIDELARHRDPGRRPGGEGRAEAGVPGAVATAPADRCASASAEAGPLGPVAHSLLRGRLATEPVEVRGADGPTPSGPAPTEPFDAQATADREAREAVRADSASGSQSSLATMSGSAVLPGGTQLSSVERSGRRLPFFRSVGQIGRQAAQGLAYAHGRGVVHRDIKPSNLLLDTAGVVWITDFGLAKAEDDGLTASGDILGTLRYMAPERFRGKGDARADIYALGLTLYELLTLRPAYETNDRLKLIEQIKNEEPARPRSIDGRIPRDLETIVVKAIDKEPARRYQSAEAMAEDLRRFLDDEPILARRATVTERYWRWARRHPAIAILGAVLTAVLVLATTASLIVAGRMARLADTSWHVARAERSAREEASRRATAEAQARTEAEAARTAALAETYRATLHEARALRAARQPGWRDKALGHLARLASWGSPRRDLLELRTEAAAALGTPDVYPVARFELPSRKMRFLSFSPDSQTLVTADSEAGLHFWGLDPPRHLRTVGDLAVLDSNPYEFRERVVHLPDGRSLVVATSDHGVVFTDASGLRSSHLPITRGAASPTKLAIDAAGRSLAVSWTDPPGITVHDLERGTIVLETEATPFDLSPDGQWLAQIGPSHQIQLHRIGSNEAARILGRHEGAVITLAFSPDGATLATTSWDRTTTLWDVAGQKRPVVLRGHRDNVNGAAFSPDGEWVATASSDFTARIWDTQTGQLLVTLPGPWVVVGVAWSPDGRSLATCDSESYVQIYRVTDRRVFRRLVGHTRGVQCVAAHPHLDRIATGADDGRVIDWDLSRADPTPILQNAPTDWAMAIAYSPDGSLMATSGSNSGPQDRPILLRDVETGAERFRLAGHNTGIHALAFDASGQRLASGDEHGKVIVWDLDTRQPLRELQVGPSWVWSIAFLNDGRKLLCKVSNGPITLYDLSSGEVEAQVILSGGIRRFVADPPRRRVIAACYNGDLVSLSLPDLSPSHRLDRAHDGPIESLSLSPEGRLLATGGSDRRVILRDAETFEPLVAFPEWTAMVKDVVFTPSGRWLAYVGADSDVALWDLTALQDGLLSAGLAWNRPAPTAAPNAEPLVSTEPSAPPVVVIRPPSIDPAEVLRAIQLAQAGIDVFEQGRFADAIGELERAVERFRKLRQSYRSHPVLASGHAMAHVCLASSLRRSDRPADALGHLWEAIAIFESIRSPTPADLYITGCAYAQAAELDAGEPGLPGAITSEPMKAKAVGFLRRALELDSQTILPLLATEDDLDPLRDRPDFPPLQLLNTLSGADCRQLMLLDRQIGDRPKDPELRFARAQFFSRRRLWAHAEPEFREFLRLRPVETWGETDRDTWVAMRISAQLAKTRDFDEHRRLSRALIDHFAQSSSPSALERIAKSCLLTPPPDNELPQLIEMTDRAVRLGESHPFLPWFELARGLAAYRAGKFLETTNWLRPLLETQWHGLGMSTARVYLAMAEHQLGNSEQALEHIASVRGTHAQMLDPGADWGDGWHDWLILELALEEAEALVSAAPGPPVEPNPGDR